MDNDNQKTPTVAYIRNDGMGPRNIGSKLLLPGEAKAFTLEEMEPFKGSKDLEIAFKRGTLKVVNGEEAVDLLFTQPSKPNEKEIPGSASALNGDPNAVNVDNAASLAAFIKANPPPAPVGVPVPVTGQ